jgi:DNA repair protein RecO (recombination protein O)
MDETYQTKAIILNRQPFREYDTRVSVFCLDRGRLELVARGTKKMESKLAGHLEPICLSNIMIVRGRQYDYVGSSINENSFINIKNDLDKLFLAGKAISVFQRLVKENEEDVVIFRLFENFLQLLNEDEGAEHCSARTCNLLLNFFILKLLVALGYKPELYNCVICKKKIVPNNNKFDFARGGVVCGRCASPPAPLLSKERELLTITDDCIKVLRMVVDSDLQRLTKINIDNKLEKEVKKIVSTFYKYHFS